ncbi:dynein axonemal assembly factor 4-like isoform X1 [Acropora palmata]|uniref:dynein axonemal assembly factor 4-like isoform X1 n=1 Tax=Acropora palmata TaxID=6131 RepID=UPI003DA0206A
MTIKVKDYLWEETEETVFIYVPLKGVPANRVDIFSSDDYIKVSFPPYIFEVFLHSEVEDAKSKAIFCDGMIKFQLVKKNPVQWNNLQVAELVDKEFMKRKREEAIMKVHKRSENELTQKAEEKRKQERIALREQMKIEQEERANFEAIKEEERKSAMQAIEHWKQGQRMQSYQEHKFSRENKPTASHVETTLKDKEETFLEGKVIQQADHTQKLRQKPAVEEQLPKRRQTSSDKNKELFEKPVPEPRSSGSISVSFTPRIFKTAARESKAPEEKEWLKKMASVGCKAHSTNSDAVDMEEMNPLWLKDKGIGFFKAGNVVAAVSAFTAAIVLDDSIPSLYSNRAACHLQLKQYKECIQDCSSALELLVPPVEANRASRCKAHVRRGTAYLQREEYLLALHDYESALKLDSQSRDLQKDVEKIKRIIQGSK